MKSILILFVYSTWITANALLGYAWVLLTREEGGGLATFVCAFVLLLDIFGAIALIRAADDK